ncbi:MAG: outer membrane beta-barrel protein [Acidobacteria bacterium]|nr:outer membrane beta-barrel protein [Acidobacteriota bacterium]
MVRRLAVLVCGLAFATATPALAQVKWTDRAFAGLSTGIQIGTSGVTNTQTFELFGEEASLLSQQDVKGGLFFDGQFGYKVWNNVALGVGITFTQAKADAALTGSLPDPVFFSSPRSATAAVADLAHREIWYSALATWVMPVTDKIDVFFSGGPAFVQVEQELPNSVTVTEPGPSITDVGVTKFSKSGIGFVAAADMRYMITSRIGVGALAKFSASKVDITEGTSMDVGGFQLGAGIRMKF